MTNSKIKLSILASLALISASSFAYANNVNAYNSPDQLGITSPSGEYVIHAVGDEISLPVNYKYNIAGDRRFEVKLKIRNGSVIVFEDASSFSVQGGDGASVVSFKVNLPTGVYVTSTQICSYAETTLQVCAEDTAGSITVRYPQAI